MAFLRAAVILAFVAFASASDAAANALKEEQRTIFIDGGSTDSFGVTDVFLYIGTFTLAILTTLAIIGLIYGVQETGSTGYEAPTAGSYTSYDHAYQVARALYDGYKKYEEARSAN
ncbi:uncharacterized protein [Penaeus vannamei]|uniref:uncharacterized protein n=1 Tax=Penaeus vannamei TaxID=6689 RepID=UPI000F69263C|nr:uncharacterized protein LOC113819582 [Penaeus vannamei]